MRNSIKSLVMLLIVPASLHAEVFVSPIGGIPFEDWTIVNYVDLDSGPGKIDFNGGNYTYDGHNAIDFTLPNFAAMDAGVGVYAASPGIVYRVHDGEYDRWSRANPTPSGAKANRVEILHANGVVTKYLHLRRDSVTVKVGDTVSAGQQIGLVGSSGSSSDAHLHFSVHQNGEVVETYQNPSSWWQDPLPYAGDVHGTLDFGIIDHRPNVEERVERPIRYDRFDIQDGTGQSVYSWASVFGFKDGDQVDYYFFEPDGDEFFHSSSTSGQIRYGWWTTRMNLPDDPELGLWEVEAKLNGESLFRDSFRVFDSAAVPEPSPELVYLIAICCVVGMRWRVANRCIGLDAADRQ